MNSLFFDDKNKSLVTHHAENRDYNNDYDDYNSPNARRVDKITFTMLGLTDKKTTSILWLKQKAKQDRLVALYRHSNVKDYPDLINLDDFQLTLDHKKGTSAFKFYNGKILGIGKALQIIQAELDNNTLEYTETNERTKKGNKKLKEAKCDPTYSEEERQP